MGHKDEILYDDLFVLLDEEDVEIKEERRGYKRYFREDIGDELYIGEDVKGRGWKSYKIRCW